jgi:hypothetical protein
MTDTTVSAALRVAQWDDKHHVTYVRGNRFKPYMGTDENAIIQLKEDLTKKPGDAITIPLVGALDATAGPNDGTTSLVGNEKALPNDGHKITVSMVRDAVAVSVIEEKKSPIDIREAGKVALADLQTRYLRNSVITALGSVGGVAYGTASAAQKNAWNATNSDRVLFGTLRSNYNATHATALLNVTAAMKLSKAVVSLMKRIAQTATAGNGDGIRPYKYGMDEESYLMFVGTNAFRDLKNDIGTEWKDAQERGKSNPLFVGTTSIYWDGVVVREIPEMAATGAVGAAGATVAPVYLCGAQALAVAWGARTKTTVRKEDDYGLKYGVGFMEMRGVEKILYGTAGKDWGMVTGFVGAAADA